LPAEKRGKKGWEEQRLGSKSVKKLDAKDSKLPGPDSGLAEQAQTHGEAQSQKYLQRQGFQTNEKKMKEQQARH